MSSLPTEDTAPPAAPLAPPQSWTIGQVLTWSTSYLRDRGLVDSPRLDAELLLGHALDLPRIQLYAQFDKPLSVTEREPFKAFLKRRCAGEPVAYIIGAKDFMGYRFAIGPAVLIPRPDTEVLVETVMGFYKDSAPKILDVGTGSGCIAISLALKLPQAQVTAWDLSVDALAVAKTNAETLGAAVTFAKVDALAPSSWDAAGTFDVIVSNPPYISPDEAPALAKSVVGFEPGSALFAPPDGLAFYRILAERAAACLVAGGRLAVEIGATQAAAVSQLLTQAGWQDVRVLKDYGRNDRVVTASRPHG